MLPHGEKFKQIWLASVPEEDAVNMIKIAIMWRMERPYRIRKS
ncbi:MAG: hypothetical protein KatS3mg031_2972 [Chitinophagales bacterium]|nr:MAG: hypothetical protein KatS3mg031_2972 [Chitinophagales bacterium]